MMKSTTMVVFLMVGLLLSGPFMPANACTGIKVQTDDGAVVTGRTLEFGLTAPYAVTIVPRNTEVTAAGPGGKPGKSWKSTFATVGVSGWGQPTAIPAAPVTREKQDGF
jgi:choloylglycine hydrolase